MDMCHMPKMLVCILLFQIEDEAQTSLERLLSMKWTKLVFNFENV